MLQESWFCYIWACLCALMYINEKLLWEDREKCRIRVVPMANLKGFLSIDSIPNARVKDLCHEEVGHIQ